MASALQGGVLLPLPQAACASTLVSGAKKVKDLFEALASVTQEARCVTPAQHKDWSPAALTGLSSSEPQDIVERVDAATWKDGVLLLPDLGPMMPPWKAIRALFDFLSNHPEVVAELNSLYPSCNIVKDAALDASRADADVIDQKVAFDLNAQRLAALLRVPTLVEKLGAPLQSVLHFFQEVGQKVVPKLMQMTSLVSGQDLAACHNQRNFNFRVIDYPEHVPKGSAKERRCGAHRDFGTFTIVFPDREGLQVEREGGYYNLPGDTPQLFFGYCGAILSNDRLAAAKHRVVDTPAKENGLVARRNSLVFFVAPDENTPLRPVVKAGEVAKFRSGVTSSELKEAMKRKWKAREGTLGKAAGAEAGSQDEVIDQFMRLPEAV